MRQVICLAFIASMLLASTYAYMTEAAHPPPEDESIIADTIEDIKRWDNRIRLAKKGGWDTRIRLAKKLVTDWDKRIRLAKKSRLRLMKKDWDTRIRLAKKSSSSSSGQEDYDEAYQINEENNAILEGGDDKRSGHIRLI